MSVYAGDFADLYDLFYADKPYDHEVDFVDRLLRDHARGPSRRLVDVACGTGQHAVRFAERGWDVVAIDHSADMLARARLRPASRPIRFLQQDMTRLDLGVDRFDAAVCLFDSIGYGATHGAVRQTLTAIRQHLRRNALFALEFWHAPAMIREYEPLRVREWVQGDERIIRLSRTRLDVVAQLARVDYSIWRLRRDGSFREWNEAHENRFFLVQEMDLLLRLSEFEPLAWMAGFDADRPIDASTWHVLVLARTEDQSP